MHREFKTWPGSGPHCFLSDPLASHRVMATLSCKGGQVMCDQEEDKDMNLINFTEP